MKYIFIVITILSLSFISFAQEADCVDCAGTTTAGLEPKPSPDARGSGHQAHETGQQSTNCPTVKYVDRGDNTVGRAFAQNNGLGQGVDVDGDGTNSN